MILLYIQDLSNICSSLVFSCVTSISVGDLFASTAEGVCPEALHESALHI